MKIWKGEKETITGSDKWQEIKYAHNKDLEDDNLSPYVRFRNQRIWLDEFIVSPNGYKEESDLCGTPIHAACSISWSAAYLISISDCGDKAKVFYSYIK